MIRVGILGAGNIGRVHARQYHKMDDVSLYAFDTHTENTELLAREYHAKPCFSERELISKVDILDVCTPTDAHYASSLRAIAAGRHVFVEKPMAASIADCVEMINASEKAGLLLMPGHVVRYFPEFEKAHDLVQSGKIGQPLAARTHRGGRLPKGAGNWFMDFSRSGGVLVDLAIHDFDWLRWTFGEVQEVCSKALMGRTDQGDYALSILKFDSGVLAHVESTWLDPSGFNTALEVSGSKGFIEFDHRESMTFIQNTVEKSYRSSPLLPREDPYYKQLRDFIEAVRTDRKSKIEAHDGLVALSIALAAVESSKRSCFVKPSRYF